MDKTFYVYMFASARNGTLYLGVTSDLMKRVWQHREGMVEGFTKEYGVKQLVWFETHTDAISAITREKQLKKMESGVDDKADSVRKPVLAGSVRRTHGMTVLWVPAFAGKTSDCSPESASTTRMRKHVSQPTK